MPFNDAETFSFDARLTYGVTPPKLSNSEERRREISKVQTARISSLPIDALVVYDLQDESSRTNAKRPFKFLQSIDSLEYAYDYLGEVACDKIVYRSVSGYEQHALVEWLKRLGGLGGAAVLVGAPSREQAVKLSLGDAYRTRLREARDVPLGGVLIAERHEAAGTEVERALNKQDKGCSFFISQAVYSVSASKNLLSDLYYRYEALERPMPPVLVTLSPCGSQKTLEFMDWLGVSVPRWLQNELTHARDILATSVEVSLAIFEELHDFASEKGISLGCNVESVSLQRSEIDASVEMVRRAARILGRRSDAS